MPLHTFLSSSKLDPEDQERRANISALIYVGVLMVVGAVINYFTYSPNPVHTVSSGMFLLWMALYGPLFVYVLWAKWPVPDFGFTSNWRLLLVLVAMGLILLLNFDKNAIPQEHRAFVIGFARTGEELFSRGFVYALMLRLGHKWKRRELWAIVLSSLIFTLVHTHTFRPDYRSTMLDVFFIAMVFAWARHWTRSILPGVLVHCGIQAGIPGMLWGSLIYAIITLWGYLRKESASI